ncbi:MAG: sodium:proton exchanger [Marinilabiliales bacterium]|nr:MAG: sodium:proton exchanger [Marinilabiliales bacterium]
MLVHISLLIIGLVLLIKGADWLVKGASVLAKKYNISDLAIGLTIVAFGTSAPELIVNIIASAKAYPDIVFGNIIGSNNFNLFVILGLTGIITPIAVQSSTVWKEIPLSLIAVIVLFILATNYVVSETFILSRIDGVVLFALFAGFLFYVYKQLKNDTTDSELNTISMSGIKIWSFILLGLTGLVIGGKLLVDNAVDLATILGVSEKIIGLTIVAAGTSMPELATSIVAAIKKNNDIAVGNIIGSNIFNLFFILSVSSFVKPLNYNIKFNTDLIILAAGTIFLFVAMFTGQKKKLDRWEAALLLVFYIAYTIYFISKG